jgi:hypothetical protein
VNSCPNNVLGPTWPPAETPETATSARKFPTPGRYELTLGWCIPVIMSEKTFSAKTSNELYVLWEKCRCSRTHWRRSTGMSFR